MTRMAATTCAVGLALAMTASAQQSTTVQTTQAASGEARMISYTGCVGAGSETRSYVLDKVVPVTKTTETVGTSGTVSTTTTTSYMLVPGDKVEIQEHMGHKVEVTGMLIPAGDSKTTTTTTRVDPPNSQSTTVTETKSKNPTAQFRVMSIKDLAQSCE